MPLGVLLLVGAGAFIAGALLLAIRRAARVLYRARRRGDFGLALGRIGREVTVELEVVLGRVDAVRRDQLAPAEIVSLLVQTVDTVGSAGQRVKTMAVPSGGAAVHDAVGHELLRASSALEAILDACIALEGTTQGDRVTRARKSLQWGHLNLVRVRESLMGHAAEAEAFATPGKQGWRASRI